MVLRLSQPRLKTSDSRRLKPAPKFVDPHYGTPEHKAWRNRVIGRARGRCQWPGCGKAEAKMYADHIIELRDGGAALDPDNGQCLCASHHTLKTAQARAARFRADGGAV